MSLAYACYDDEADAGKNDDTSAASDDNGDGIIVIMIT